MRDEGGGVDGHREHFDGLPVELDGVHGAVGMDPLHEQGRQLVGAFLEGLDGDGRPDVQETGVVRLDLLHLHGVHLPHRQGQDILHVGVRDLRVSEDRAVGHVVQLEAVQEPVRHEDGIPRGDGLDERGLLEDDPSTGLFRGGVAPGFLGRCGRSGQEEGGYETISFHRLWNKAIRFLT